MPDVQQQPRVATPIASSRRALVVFEDRADSWHLRLLRPGFRHCFCVIGIDGLWVICDPLKARIELTPIQGFVESALAERLALPGRTVLRGAGGALLALPWLEAHAATGLPPRRLIIFFTGLAVAWIVLERGSFGRKVYVIGSNAEVARYSGVPVDRVKLSLFTTSGFVAGLAGVLFAARLGSVRGSLAEFFELDIITIVLLAGLAIAAAFIWRTVNRAERPKTAPARAGRTARKRR